MADRLERLAAEAEARGWRLLVRHQPWTISYVLVTDTGEIECETLNNVGQHMRLKDGGWRP
jgi:hypothetical protein